MKQWMKLVENASIEFFHGSMNELEIGTVLTPRGSGCGEEIEELLERHRPADCIPRNKCIYMVSELRALDTVLPDYDYAYVVEPSGPVQRFDAVWLDRLLSGFNQIDNGIAFPEGRQIAFAQGYWSGQPCLLLSGEARAWEYLCSSATVAEAI